MNAPAGTSNGSTSSAEASFEPESLDRKSKMIGRTTPPGRVYWSLLPIYKGFLILIRTITPF